MSVEVRGVQQTKALLDKMPREMVEAAAEEVGRMRASVGRAVEARIPSGPPLSGFDHHGRTGWANGRGRVITEKGDGKRRGSNEFPLCKIILTGAAAVMTDMAGAGGGGKTRQGQAMTRGLSSRYGRASRWVYPAVEAQVRQVEKAAKAGVEKAARAANNRMEEVR